MLIYHHHHRSELSRVRVISRKNSQKVFSSRAQYISINYFKNADHLQQIYSNFLSRIVKRDLQIGLFVCVSFSEIRERKLVIKFLPASNEQEWDIFDIFHADSSNRHMTNILALHCHPLPSMERYPALTLLCE
jgi:hypothetical protein